MENLRKDTFFLQICEKTLFFANLRKDKYSSKPQRFGLLRRQVRDFEVHLPAIEKSQRFGLLRVLYLCCVLAQRRALTAQRSGPYSTIIGKSQRFGLLRVLYLCCVLAQRRALTAR